MVLSTGILAAGSGGLCEVLGCSPLHSVDCSLPGAEKNGTVRGTGDGGVRTGEKSGVLCWS